jgi:DNA-binding MarR family transcriptional regulator
MRSNQLTPILEFNPKLSGGAIRIFLLIAEHRKGITQADVKRLLRLPKSTVSRQVAILSDKTQKGTEGMCLISRTEIRLGGFICNHLQLTEKGQEIYALMS